MLYSFKVFGGSMLRIGPKLIKETQAVRAENNRIDSGELKPWNAPLFLETPTKIGTLLSIYRWAPVPGDDDSGFWFHWTTDVDVASGPINSDTLTRTYFTGDGVPKMTYAGIATAGGTNYPENDYDLGLPAPSTAPSTALTGTIDPEADPVEDLVERIYLTTYVTSIGEDGPPSVVSNVLGWLPGQTVDLSAIPAAPAGAFDVTHIKIFRTATGASGTDFYFVAMLAIGTATYNDAILDSNLGEVIQSEEYYQPPTDMHSIGSLPTGMLYGFSGKSICVSELYLPHAWAPDNQVPLPDEIVAGGSFGNTIVAITHKNPFVITGIDPQSLVADEYKINQSCVSKRSCVSTRFGVIYASPDGLILVGPNGADNIIDGYLRISQWQELKPESILGTVYDNKYLGFYDNGVTQGGFIIDPSLGEDGFVFISLHATAAYQDPLSDSLYLVVDDDIVEWDKGTKLTYEWLTKEMTGGRARNFSVGRVLAEEYSDITVELYADGVLKHTEVVTSEEVFRMPGGYKARTHQLKISGTSKIYSVDIASTLPELRRTG